MVNYLEAGLEDGDPSLIQAAIGDIARARGMSDIARKVGLGLESLYKSLGGKRQTYCVFMCIFNSSPASSAMPSMCHKKTVSIQPVSLLVHPQGHY